MKVLSAVVAVAVLGAIGVLYAVAFDPVMEERARLSRELDALQKTNETLRARIAELQRRQTDFKTDPSYVELEAHRMGLSRANETVFDFSVERK